MSHSLQGTTADQKPKDVLARTLKLVIAGVFIAIGIYYVGTWLSTMIESTEKSRIEGDLKTIGKAIDRRRLKDPILETDLTLLKGGVLENVPRDAWGNPYYYDWFNERLVCMGPDGVLSTPIPGFSTQSAAENDDIVYQLKPPNDFIVACERGETTDIVMIRQDGSDPVVLTQVASAVDGLAGLGEGNILVLTTRTGDLSKLQTYEFAEKLNRLRYGTPPFDPKVSTVLEGKQKLEWPCLYSPNNDWLFYDSIEPGQSTRKVHKVDYRDKRDTLLSEANADAFAPAIDSENKLIYLVGQLSGRCSIFRFAMASYKTPEPFMNEVGGDFLNPAPSHDGARVAFLGVKDGTSLVKVVDAKSKKILATIENVQKDTPIVWSPEDDKIAYFTAPQGKLLLTMTHVTKQVHYSVEVPEQNVKALRFVWIRG